MRGDSFLSEETRQAALGEAIVSGGCVSANVHNGGAVLVTETEHFESDVRHRNTHAVQTAAREHSIFVL